MKYIENNLNREEILEINDRILLLAVETDLKDPAARTRASKKYWELVEERKRIYLDGIPEGGSMV